MVNFGAFGINMRLVCKTTRHVISCGGFVLVASKLCDVLNGVLFPTILDV